jgi:hypothetical protein
MSMKQGTIVDERLQFIGRPYCFPGRTAGQQCQHKGYYGVPIIPFLHTSNVF